MRRAFSHGLASATLMLALTYYWFAVADRYAVFLYAHVDNPGHAPALPFDAITSGRYWMTGFVAGGGLAILYLCAMFLAGRRAARRGESYRPPPAWLAWLFATPVLVAGIPWITMTANDPVMPPGTAVALTASALLALALALAPGKWAAERPVDLLWLAALGFGLEPVLTTWRAVELPARGIFTERQAWGMMAFGVGASLLWLWGVTWLYRRQSRTVPDGSDEGAAGVGPGREPVLLGAGAILWAGLTWHVLGQPLAHHLFATPPGFRYITSAGNIFAGSAWVWLASVAVAGGIAALAPWLALGVRWNRGEEP